MKKLVGIFFLCGFIFVVVYFNGNIKKHLPPIENNDTLKRSVKKTKLEEHFFSKLSDTWEIHRYSFPENGCEMMDSQVSINKSKLVLSVELNRKNASKPYKGGEISSVIPFLYGQFSVRMKNKIAPGTVSSFFIMNKWQPENWEQKEIDIEFLGKNTKTVLSATSISAIFSASSDR